MALRMLRPSRRADELDRWRLDLPAVYRYVFAVLPDEADAEEVTLATFEHARRRLAAGRPRGAPRAWLVTTAHDLCRARVADADGGPSAPLDGGECTESERLVSSALDGRIPSPDRRRLREHLRVCAACRARVRTHLAVRRALRSLACTPLPPRLAGGDDDRFTSSGGGGSLAGEERRSMAIITRRNAVLGWAVWRVGKRVARRKAKEAVPSIDTDSMRPNKPAVAAAAVAALVGGLVFLRRVRNGASSTA
jgi:DNA-directed RNA polymerase specialized sigma24 family protein